MGLFVVGIVALTMFFAIHTTPAGQKVLPPYFNLDDATPRPVIGLPGPH
jgi:hypothetical protein